jgi:hypothetical protein
MQIHGNQMSNHACPWLNDFHLILTFFPTQKLHKTITINSTLALDFQTPRAMQRTNTQNRRLFCCAPDSLSISIHIGLNDYSPVIFLYFNEGILYSERY